MATPTELLDPPAVMSYSGLVDASTVEGQVDEAADWNGAIAAMLVGPRRDGPAAPRHPSADAPAKHLRQITRRRGAYSPVR
jgi:hypothetical protein